MRKVEYHVAIVERYQISRHWSDENSGGIEVVGEFEDEGDVRKILEALRRAEGEVSDAEVS